MNRQADSHLFTAEYPRCQLRLTLCTTPALECATLRVFLQRGTQRQRSFLASLCQRNEIDPTWDWAPRGTQPNYTPLRAMPWAKLLTYVGLMANTSLCKSWSFRCANQGDTGLFHWGLNCSRWRCTSIWLILQWCPIKLSVQRTGQADKASLGVTATSQASLILLPSYLDAVPARALAGNFNCSSNFSSKLLLSFKCSSQLKLSCHMLYSLRYSDTGILHLNSRSGCGGFKFCATAKMKSEWASWVTPSPGPTTPGSHQASAPPALALAAAPFSPTYVGRLGQVASRMHWSLTETFCHHRRRDVST